MRDMQILVTTGKRRLTTHLLAHLDSHTQPHVDSELKTHCLQDQPLDTHHPFPLFFQQIRIHSSQIYLTLLDELWESQSIRRQDDVARFLECVVDFGRDVEGREGQFDVGEVFVWEEEVESHVEGLGGRYGASGAARSERSEPKASE